MKLTNIYSAEEKIGVAVVEGHRAPDLAKLEQREAAFASLACWFRHGDGARHRTPKLLEQANNQPDLWRPLDSIRYMPLVDRHCRIFCVGLNYADHAAENNLAPPASTTMPIPKYFLSLAMLCRWRSRISGFYATLWSVEQH